MIAIVVSRADSASVHVGEHLLEQADWEVREDPARPPPAGGGTYHTTEGFELRTFDELHLDLVRPAEAFDDPDMLVFASRHAGDTGPLLTAHFTGNLGPAEYGGRDGELAEACPNALSRLLVAFDDHAPSGYDIGLECTHHGPSDVGVPSMFVELGSDEAQWSDPTGAAAVARSILDLRGVAPRRDRQLVGFGGGHYVPRFERLVRETAWAVGHVASAWALEAMGDPAEHRDVIRQVFERSAATHAVIDGDHPRIKSVIDDLGYRVVSETWVRAVGDRPLSLVDDLEGRLQPVDDGLRFGEPTTDRYEIVDLPDDLLATAQGIDRDGVRSAIERYAVAFETREGGSRVAGRAAIPEGEYDALVDDLASILEARYDEVARQDDAVVAVEQAFDPERASDLGVPPGPAFGTLASGEPVTVDGETIDPDAVTVRRTHRFEL